MESIINFLTEGIFSLPGWFVVVFTITFVSLVFFLISNFSLKEKMKEKLGEKDKIINELKNSNSKCEDEFKSILKRCNDYKTYGLYIKRFSGFFREIIKNNEMEEENFLNMLYNIVNTVFTDILSVSIVKEINNEFFVTEKCIGSNEVTKSNYVMEKHKSNDTIDGFEINGLNKTAVDFINLNKSFFQKKYENEDLNTLFIYASSFNHSYHDTKNYLFFSFEEEKNPVKPEISVFFDIIISFYYLRKKYISIQDNFERKLIISMIKILELYDPFIKGHSENVSRYASLLSEEIEISDEDKIKLYWSSMVHDIGKIMVPSTILRKAGRYTSSEFEILKKHPEWGAEILSSSQELDEIALFIRHHHERWDGRGYPDGLSGEDIPLISRIIHIADSFDNLTSNRSLRKGLTKIQAIEEMKELSGTLFDPELLDIFVKKISVA